MNGPGRKTVMLVVHGGYPARYLLRTQVLPTLLEADVRVVILTPNADEEYFRREFEHPNVSFEQYRLEACRAYRDGSRLQRFLKSVRHATLDGRGDLTTLDYNFSVLRDEARSLPARLMMHASWVLVRVARRFRLVRRAISAFEQRLFAPPLHRDVFERTRPDLVVTTSLGYFDFDQFVMREARRMGARIVSVVLSWDNPTSWGIGAAPSDGVITWTEMMRDEVILYHNVPADRVAVAGAAHFDRYTKAVMSRDELVQQLGLDPDRRIILLGNRAPTRFPWNETVIEMIARAIEDGRLAGCQLLVRVHPIHFRERDGRRVHQAVLDRYAALQARYGHVLFDHPAILSRRLPLDMPADDMDKLAALLKHSSALVTMLSTLNIEAAIFDLPTVNVCFGAYGRTGQVSMRENEPVAGQSFTHIKRLIGYDASTLVHNEEEMVAAIRRCLDDPAYQREARARLAVAESGPNRGAAGAAVACELLRWVGAPASTLRVARDLAVAGGPA